MSDRMSIAEFAWVCVGLMFWGVPVLGIGIGLVESGRNRWVELPFALAALAPFYVVARLWGPLA